MADTAPQSVRIGAAHRRVLHNPKDPLIAGVLPGDDGIGLTADRDLLAGLS